MRGVVVIVILILVLNNSFFVHCTRGEYYRFPTGPEVGYFWQITDPHVDLNYTIGANTDCDIGPFFTSSNSKGLPFPSCCRSYSATGKGKAGMFGDYGGCDIPHWTLQQTFDFVKHFSRENGIKPDFYVYGGDDVPHTDWEQSREINLGYMRFVHNMLRTTFPGETFFPTIGNHDVYPVDQLDLPPKNSWLTYPVAELWRDWLPADVVNTTVQYAGYYSVLIEPGLRMISINTQYADKMNFWLYASKNMTDPVGQMQWLDNELAKALSLSERVILIGHIPPGQDDRDIVPGVLPQFNNLLEDIIARYSATVIVQLYGHTHTDSFRVFRNPQEPSQATGIAFVASAITPFTSHNPSVRLYMYNRSCNFELIDYVTFYANLTESNQAGEMKWQMEYSAREAYSLPSLSPAAFADLVERMKRNETLFHSFEQFYVTMNWNAQQNACSGICKVNQLCSLSHVNWSRYKQCVLDNYNA